MSYSYSFALFAAFDDLATGDDYKRYTHPYRAPQLIILTTNHKVLILNRCTICMQNQNRIDCNL